MQQDRTEFFFLCFYVPWGKNGRVAALLSETFVLIYNGTFFECSRKKDYEKRISLIRTIHRLRSLITIPESDIVYSVVLI